MSGPAAGAAPAVPGAGAARARRAGGRYSRFVDLMRWLLPATALALVMLVLAWPHAMGTYGRLIVPGRTGGADAGDPATLMERPRYVGRTSKDEPFAVTADSARVDPRRPDVIHLDGLDARLTAAAEARDLTLTAPAAVYRRSAERLGLSGGIELTSSDGYRFETERARVDLAEGRVVGPRPVRGEGPAGRLSASRFEIDGGGDVLRFQGAVKVTLQPRPAPAARPAPGEPGS